jgi:hypothetical protein
MIRWETRAGTIWCVLGIVLANAIAPEAAGLELADFSTAVKFCSNHKTSIKLNEDRTILCFDGPITADPDPSVFYQLKQNGLFVVRSPGGIEPVAVILSNILLEKNATVVVYDYCLSACANVFLIATSRTYVRRNTIVAWHGGAHRIYCGAGDIERLRKSYGGAPGTVPPELACQTGELLDAFFRQRGIDTRHIREPQTTYTKKMVNMAAREADNKRKIFWMWHPQNYGDYFKSKVTYESYPNSQDDVDEISSRLRLGARIFYDPPRP